MGPTPRAPHRRLVRTVLPACAVFGVLLSNIVVWQASEAAFNGKAANPADSWSAGQVVLSDDDTGADNDSGTALFTVTGLIPGQTAAKCIRVTYSGNTAAKVRMYASALSDAQTLGQYVELQIEEGTGTAEFDGTPACGNGDATFTADRVLYGSGLTGTVANFGTLNSYATGLPQSTEWTPSGTATKVYKVTYRLDATTPSGTHQNKTCTIAFRWEAVT
jgi:hypothetical protein